MGPGAAPRPSTGSTNCATCCGPWPFAWSSRPYSARSSPIGLTTSPCATRWPSARCAGRCLTSGAPSFGPTPPPDGPYPPPWPSPLPTGPLCGALIAFGRPLFRPTPDTGGPAGIPGLVLPALGIILGYLGGNLLAAWWCGFSSWAPGGGAQLRISIGITLLAGFAVIYFFYSDSKHTRLHARMDE